MGRIDRRILTRDTGACTIEMFNYNLDTGDIVIEHVQDVEAIKKYATARFNDVDERAPWKDNFNHVADIPLIFLQIHPELMYDNKALKKWLNDPDNRAWRTRPGRL